MPLSAMPLTYLILAAIAVAPVEAPKPAETVTLRYRFDEGETIHYRIDQEATLYAQKGMTRETTFSRSRTEQRLNVVSVDPAGVTTLRLSIEQARMEYAFNGAKPTVLDSRKKNLPAGVDQAIGRPLAEVRVDSSGRVDAIEPLLSAAELNAVPGKLGLDDEAAGTLFVRLPDKPVAIGDTWHDTIATRVAVTQHLKQEIKLLRQYRLDRIDEGVAVIDVKTSILTPVTEPALLVQLIQRTSSGTIRFDISTGRIVDWNVAVDNTEISWHGADSSLRAVSKWSETLITEPTTLSAR